MSPELSSDISNWHYVVVELFVGAFLAFFFWVLQYKTSQKMEEMTDRIDKLTQQKATAQQEKKAYECRRIIEHLQYLHNAELNLKTFLTEYNSEDPTHQQVKSFYGMSIDGIARTGIYNMNDAIEQLQGRLNDISLRKNLMDYLGAFSILPERILRLNMPQQEYQCQGLILLIDAQLKKIQEFIGRFSKERDSS